MTKDLDRRRFLSHTLQAGAIAPLAFHVSRILPSDSVNLAIIGCNARGLGLARQFIKAGAEIAVLCDVDARLLPKRQKAIARAQNREPGTERDFRRVLDDKSIDAIVIATPDHWHASIAIAGMAAGKHIYVEKPLSHNAHEGELVVTAAKKYGRGALFGTQRRSSVMFREMIKRLHAGVIGKVSFARCWYARKRQPIGRGKRVAVPEGLDFDLWQGPAPRCDYRDNVIHYNWHWFWNWGTGELGNNGVHFLDLCRWGLGVSGHPRRVTSGGGTYSHRDDQETPDTQVVTFDYGDVGITFDHRNWHARGLDGSSTGCAFYGSKGSLVCDTRAFRVFDPKGQQLAEVKGDGGDVAHTEKFLQCIRSGDTSVDSIEEGHKTTLLCHLGNIAYRTGQTVECDPRTGHIVGSKETKALWRREYESGWEPRVG